MVGANSLCALLGNMQEHSFSSLKDHRMAPVRFMFPGGFMIVMVRCKPISTDDYHAIDINWFWQQKECPLGFWADTKLKAKVPVEFKLDSFGWLGNEIVAVDYGS